MACHTHEQSHTIVHYKWTHRQGLKECLLSPCLCTKINIPVGCKHRTSEGVFYIRGRGFVCQIIEPVTFARCAFIFALRNIALGGYLDTRRNI